MNNPLRYTDPTGHKVACDPMEDDCHTDPSLAPSKKENRDGKNKCKNSDPDCDLGRGRADGGTGPICYAGELRCQLGKDGYEQSDSWRNIQPDYWVFSGIIPLCPAAVPVCGIALSLYVDRYKNVYLAGGLGLGLPITASAGGGWFLGSGNNNEAFAEKFLQEHSLTVSGGVGLGVGVNNNYPSYIQTSNEGSRKENIAIEGLVTTPGWDVTSTYGVLIYDNGDETPWFWQSD